VVDAATRAAGAKRTRREGHHVGNAPVRFSGLLASVRRVRQVPSESHRGRLQGRPLAAIMRQRHRFTGLQRLETRSGKVKQIGSADHGAGGPPAGRVCPGGFTRHRRSHWP
jgi:hypothetical protein